MADDSSERRRSLKLSLFGSEPTAARLPRCFGDGAVGLGIVAAMSKAVGDGSVAAPALSRYDPIPIVPATPPAARDEDDGDLSESYTYVIKHVRGDHVRRVYFDGGSHGVDGNNTRSSGVFFESAKAPAPPPPPRASEFLSCCYLCQKELHGLDVFMYRGEKAFCSVECRCQQILSDEHREKCGPEESPCPAPLPFAPSVAAA